MVCHCQAAVRPTLTWAAESEVRAGALSSALPALPECSSDDDGQLIDEGDDDDNTILTTDDFLYKMQSASAIGPNGLLQPTATGAPGQQQSEGASQDDVKLQHSRGSSSSTHDSSSSLAKHPHHHQVHHPRPGSKLAPPGASKSPHVAELDAADFARLESMHISTKDDGKPAPPAAPHAAQSAGGHGQQRQNNYSGGAYSANRNTFSPTANDFAAVAAAQNGARLLAALAAGPNGMPAMPVPSFGSPSDQQFRQHRQPAPFPLPGHPIGVPMGLPNMPLTPPAAAYGFPAQLSATHQPMYDFAALQQQHLLELAAAQQAQAQGQSAPLSPPNNMTPGISPVGTIRGAPRQSPSDALPAALALLQQGMLPPQAFAPFPGAFPGAAGFYPSPTDGQYGQEIVAAMARALPQYAAAVAAAAAQAQYPGVDMNAVAAMGLGGDVHGNGGPSANNRKLGLYKTELCRSWEEKGTCRYGPKCQFAHGEDELRKVQRHPKVRGPPHRYLLCAHICPLSTRPRSAE